MKRTVMGLILFAVTLWAMAFAVPDFSGTWILNNQSDPAATATPFGAAQRIPQQITLTVKHEGNRLHVEKQRSDKPSAPVDYILDGAENTLFDTVYKAAWEEGKLIIDEVRKISTPFGETQIKTKSEWSLSADGGTLTISITAQTPMGDMKQKEVYTRGNGAW